MKENIMIISSIFLLLISGAVSVYPDSFENFTGLNTSNIDRIQFGELKNKQGKVCGNLSFVESQNVTEVTDGVSLNSSSSKGYLYYELSNVNETYIFWNHEGLGLLDTYDIWATVLINDDPNRTLTGSEKLDGRLSTAQRDFGVAGDPTHLVNLQNVSNLTIKMYDQELIIEDVVDVCSYTPADDQEDTGVLSIFSFFSDFVGYVGDFFGAVFSIIGNLFSLLTLSGNVISEWILRIVMLPQIIFWAYVVVDTLGSFFG